MKTSKVLDVKPTGPYQDRYGTKHGYNVSFENGDWGSYSSTSDNQNKFVVGQPATYEIETRTSKAGNEWYKIKPVNPEYANQSEPTTSSTTNNNYTPPPSKDVQIARATGIKAVTTLRQGSNLTPQAAIKEADVYAEYILNGQAAPPTSAPDMPDF